MKILIAVENDSERVQLSNTLQMDERTTSVANFNNEVDAYNYMCSNEVDTLIVDMVLEGVGSISLIEEAMKQRKLPKIIVLSPVSDDDIELKLFRYGVDYYVVKPYDMNTIKRRVFDLNKMAELINTDFKNSVDKLQFERQISDILIKAGIHPNLKGYRFLIRGVIYAYNDREMAESVTKMLYPTIAKEFKSNSERVERGIRHAIETAWNKSKNRDGFYNIGIPRTENEKRPTNSQFITTVIEYLKNRAVIGNF